jgi:hypothetical protein
LLFDYLFNCLQIIHSLQCYATPKRRKTVLHKDSPKKIVATKGKPLFFDGIPPDKVGELNRFGRLWKIREQKDSYSGCCP